MPPFTPTSALAAQPLDLSDQQAALAFIGLGSNLGDRYGQLRSGLAAIAATIGDVLVHSPVYEAESWGISQTPSPSYLNSVVAVRTQLSPEALLAALLGIESDHGRQRPYANAPRALDLDILLYDRLVIDTPDLTLPHPRLTQRRFVLQPLNDIAPEYVVPGTNKSVQELLATCSDELLVEPFSHADA